MPERNTPNPGLSAEELAAQEAADLPDREAMTLVDPGTVLGGSSLGGSSLTSAPTSTDPTSSSPAPVGAPSVSLPHIPVPANNPGGTYQPDASASSTTT